MQNNKENVALFGCGRLGKRLLDSVKEKHNIEYWIDNDEKKWGDVYHGVKITSPDHIKGFNGKIYIAVVDSDEIIKQLQEYGISDYQIIKYYVKDQDFIPYDSSLLPIENQDLEYYNQYNGGYRLSEKNRIIVFCSFFSTYTVQLVRNIFKRHPEIDIGVITHSVEYEDVLRGISTSIYVYNTLKDLKTILVSLSGINAIHLLWMEYEWAYFADIIRSHTDKLVVSVGGSDFYRNNDSMRKYLHKLADVADIINVESVNVRNDYLSVFPNDRDKISIVNFGLEVIDYIGLYEFIDNRTLKKEFGIPDNKLIVTCGHNAYKEHQHIGIINALSKMKAEIRNKICCVFPMTYPAGPEVDLYIEEIKNRMREAGIESRVLTKFMDFETMAKYACISDVMIHVQTTDQLSSTMLEEMYANSIVIAGSWLPYQWLKDKGIWFKFVDNIDDLSTMLPDVIENLEEYKNNCVNNKGIVYGLASWDRVANKWVDLWK